MSLIAQWSIPGLGTLRPSLDAVRIVSSATVATLKNQLPIAALEKASHKFAVVTPPGPDPTLRSVITVTGANDLSPFQILANHSLVLGNHRIVGVEIAFDIRVSRRSAGKTVEANARKKLFALIGLISKPRHFRKFLVSVHKPESIPKPGLMAEPTFYFEERKSSVALKCYCRRAKLRGGRFGRAVVRLEWTLKGKAAINRHLGGNQSKPFQLGDLMKVDVNKFAEANLRLGKLDRRALGQLVRGFRLGNRYKPSSHKPNNDSRNNTISKGEKIKQRSKNPYYLSIRAANAVLRNLAHREAGKFGEWEQALLVCRTSPAQIRGYLDPPQSRSRKRGRTKKRIRQRAISRYRIGRCFRSIELQPV